MSNHVRRWMWFLVSTSGMAACAPERIAQEQSLPTARREVQAASARATRPEEAILFQMDAAVEGFGGFYVDANGVPHLFSRNRGRDAELLGAWRSLAGQALRGAAGATRVPLSGIATIETGQFGITELASYRDQLFDAINAGELPGAVSLDLSEQTNRVALGVESQADREAGVALVSRLAIPVGSVTIRAEKRPRDLSGSRFVTATNIYDQIDTIVGGITISWRGASSSTDSLCTTGFVARTGSAARVVTASHCSSTHWSVDGSILKNAPTLRSIAYETQDPVGYICGTKTCRGSDAAMFTFYSGINNQVGLLAKTYGSGSLQWDQSSPYWTITDVERNTMFVGQYVQKSGSTTGTTLGTISDTCYDYWVSSVMMRTCQMVSTNYVEGGDSGGPVFFQNGRYGTAVTLAGLTSAKRSNGNLIFSPYQRIATNLSLSEWDVRHPSSYPGTPSWTGSVVSGHPQLTWGAVTNAVNYYVYRSWIDYNTLAQSNGFEFIGSGSSPMQDTDFNVAAFTGSSAPTFSTPGYVAYYVVAVDSYGALGIPSTIQYFRLSP